MSIADVEEIVLAPYGVDAIGNPYPPHPTQARILEWARQIREGQYPGKGIPVMCLFHGVNSGGTRAALTPAVEYMLEEPGLNVLVGRRDFNDLRLSAMRTFFEVVPQTLIVSQNVQEHWYSVQGASGKSTVFFRELKDTTGLGSQEFAVIIVCEAHEISLSAFRTLKQRCRQGLRKAMIILETNPPSEGHWLISLTNPNSPDYDPDITLVKLTSYENWDYMNPAYRESLENMPPTWKKRYLLGEAGALPDGTPVYPSFVEAVHVRDTRLIPDRPIIRGWDFGLRRAACTWIQIADSGQIITHREWMALETPETQFIEGVKVRTKEWFGDIVCQDFGDPAATQRDPQGISTLRRLSEAGISLGWRVSTYGERIPMINKLLSEMVVGNPKIIISPNCKILIEGLMGGYRYPELKEGKEFNNKRDVPFRDGWFEHIANSWEYALVNMFLDSGSKAPDRLMRMVQQRRALYVRNPIAF